MNTLPEFPNSKSVGLGQVFGHFEPPNIKLASTAGTTLKKFCISAHGVQSRKYFTNISTLRKTKKSQAPPQSLSMESCHFAGKNSERQIRGAPRSLTVTRENAVEAALASPLRDTWPKDMQPERKTPSLRNQ